MCHRSRTIRLEISGGFLQECLRLLHRGLIYDFPAHKTSFEVHPDETYGLYDFEGKVGRHQISAKRRKTLRSLHFTPTDNH